MNLATKVIALCNSISEKVLPKSGTPEYHQHKIAVDTVKNPNKALMGGPSVADSKEVLKRKFKYSDEEIAKLEEKYELPHGDYLVKTPFVVNPGLVSQKLKDSSHAKTAGDKSGRMAVLGAFEMGKGKSLGVRFYDEKTLDKVISKGYDELDKDGKWYPLLVIDATE